MEGGEVTAALSLALRTASGGLVPTSSFFFLIRANPQLGERTIIAKLVPGSVADIP
jgi:hypothetical protein